MPRNAQGRSALLPALRHPVVSRSVIVLVLALLISFGAVMSATAAQDAAPTKKVDAAAKDAAEHPALTALRAKKAAQAQPAKTEQAKAPKDGHPQGEALVKQIADRGAASAKENNSILAPLTGTWNYTAQVWSELGVEPEVTAGTITNEMELGDRFLSSKSVGSLSMERHEVMVTGQGLIGYDDAKKTFNSVWVDTLTSGMMIGTGKYDEKKKVLSESGRFTDPVDGIQKAYRSELQFTDDEHYKQTIFTKGRAGKETKLMEFNYTRKS